MGFTDYSTAAKFKEVVGGIVREYLDLERPRQAYGIVDSISRELLDDFSDWNNYKLLVGVRYVSTPDSEPIYVTCGSVVPTEIGQTVIIDGPRNNRRIVAVIGNAAIRSPRVPRIEANVSGTYTTNLDGSIVPIVTPGGGLGTYNDPYEMFAGDGTFHLDRFVGTWLAILDFQIDIDGAPPPGSYFQVGICQPPSGGAGGGFITSSAVASTDTGDPQVLGQHVSMFRIQGHGNDDVGYYFGVIPSDGTTSGTGTVSAKVSLVRLDDYNF